MNSEGLELLRTEATDDATPPDNDALQLPAPQSRVFELKMTFEPEGIKIDAKTNLNPLEQLGAVSIFHQYVLSSALKEDGK